MVVLRRICIALVAVLLVGTVFWHSAKVSNAVDDLISSIEIIEKDISTKEKDISLKEIDDLIMLWSDYNNTLSYTFEHQYLDNITMLIYSLRSLYIQDADSVYSALYEIKWSIENMRNMQQVNWGNLF